MTIKKIFKMFLFCLGAISVLGACRIFIPDHESDQVKAEFEGLKIEATDRWNRIGSVFN